MWPRRRLAGVKSAARPIYIVNLRLNRSTLRMR